MAEGEKLEANAGKDVKPVAKPDSAERLIEEHYEEVSEYRIGEGPPPVFLVLCFIFIVIWAMFSWIPLFGY